MTNEKREITLNYEVPCDAVPFAKMGFVVWQDPQNGHRHISIPWEVSALTTREDRIFVHKLGKHIHKAMCEFQKEIKAKEKAKAKKARKTK